MPPISPHPQGTASPRSVLSHIASRPMGTAVRSNASAWQMLHRRLNNPTDDRGNETTIIDEVITVALADASAGWEAGTAAYLAPRQVTARLVTHPLTLHGAPFASLAAYRAVGAVAWTSPSMGTPLPPGLHLHTLASRDGWYPPAPGNTTGGGGGRADGGAIALRLQQLPYAPPVTLDLAAWLGGLPASASISETTSDFNEDAADATAKRMVWRKMGEPSRGGGGPNGTRPVAIGLTRGALLAAAPFPVEFTVEAVRSFVVALGGA